MVIDTETGGLDAQKHSILEVAACTLGGEPIFESLVLEARREDIVIGKVAQRMHKINIDELELQGVGPTTVITRLLDAVDTHYTDGRPTLAIKNPTFDVPFLKRLYRLSDFGEDQFEKDWGHRFFDVTTLGITIQMVNKVHVLEPPQLNRMADWFDVPKPEGQHRAMVDCLYTAQILMKAFMELRSNHDFFPSGPHPR